MNQVNLSSIKNVFVSSLYISNILVVKCYNLVFQFRIFKENIGFLILFGFNIIQIILFGLFFIKGLSPIREFMRSFISIASPPKKFNQYVTSSNNTFISDENVSDDEKDSNIKLKDNKSQKKNKKSISNPKLTLSANINIYVNNDKNLFSQGKSKEKVNSSSSLTKIEQENPNDNKEHKINRNSLISTSSIKSKPKIPHKKYSDCIIDTQETQLYTTTQPNFNKKKLT